MRKLRDNYRSKTSRRLLNFASTSVQEGDNYRIVLAKFNVARLGFRIMRIVYLVYKTNSESFRADFRQLLVSKLQ